MLNFLTLARFLGAVRGGRGRRRRLSVNHAESLEVRELLTAEPFQNHLLYATTHFPEAETSFDYQVGDWDADGINDVITIQSSGTVSGNVEVFVYSSKYSYHDYSFGTGGGSTVYTDRIVTGMAAVTSSDWEFRVDNLFGGSRPDLVAIHKKQTASGFVEVTTLTGDEGFATPSSTHQTLLPVATNDWTFDIGHFNNDGATDLFAVLRNGVYSTDVVVLSGAGSNPFGTALFNGPTILPPTSANYAFVVSDLEGDGISDLFAIQKSGSKTGRIEVAVLPTSTSSSGASPFRWLSKRIETAIPDTHEDWVFDATNFASPFSPADDGIMDLIGVQRLIGSPPDIHFLSGAVTETSRVYGYSSVPSASLFTTVAQTTNGLAGSYVNQNLRSDLTPSDWRTTKTISGTRTDAAVNFPVNGMGTRLPLGLTRGTDANWDFFSVQWDGYIDVPADGVQLRTLNTDGTRLWVDVNNDGTFSPSGSEIVSNNWGLGQGLTTGPESVVLKKGLYRVRLQFEEASGANFVQLMWNYAPSAVPASAYFTSVAKNTGGIVGSYVNQSLRSDTQSQDWRTTSSIQISGTRIDPAVDFPTVSFGNRSQTGVTGGFDRDWENFSVQWDGVVVIPANGVHLQTRSDDGSRFWIDVNRDGIFSNNSTELVDNGWGTGQEMRLSQRSVDLSAGTYQIRVQYEEGNIYNSIQLLWDYIPVAKSASAIAGISSSSELRPTLFWSPATNAVAYDLWIDNRTTGKSAVVRKLTIAGWGTPEVDLGIGRFSAWIRSILPNGSTSAWSARFDFQISTPVSVLPIITTQVTARPTIAWNALSGAVKYDLWIDNLTTGTAQYVRNSNLAATSWTPPSDLPMGRYRFWVRGIDSSGTPATWSVATNITVMPAPVPMAPVLPTFEQSPTMTWNPVAGASSYGLILRNAVTGSTLYAPLGIAGTSWTVPASLPTGRYRWWVSAYSAEGSVSPSPRVIEFTVGGQPTVLGPSGSVSNSTPQISWTAVTGAVSYELWVNRLDIAVNKIVYVTGLTTPVFTPTTALPKGTYRIWVRAIGPASVASLWSAPADFSIL